ncbi:MAG: ABC transporter permease [Casimicrobiaceae bacterium]
MLVALFKPVWAYRGFILGAVRRDFQLKYANSLLGAAWNVLQPLALMVVFTLVFSQVMRMRLPGVDHPYSFSIYLCAGLFAWNFFAEIATRSQGMFLEYSGLLKKLSFPRLCLPIVTVLTSLINFGIMMVLFIVFLLITGYFPGPVVLAAIPVYLILLAFASGLGVVLGTLNVFLRDIGQLFAIVLNFWFWLTPIVYPIQAIPEPFGQWLAYNPMTPIVAALQGVFLHGNMPDWGSLVYPLLVALALCAAGLYLYVRNAAAIVDEL